MNKYEIQAEEFFNFKTGGIIRLPVLLRWSRRVSLTVSLKGSGQETDDYMRRIKHRPELTIFHGRSELNRQGIRKVYDRIDGIR